MSTLGSGRRNSRPRNRSSSAGWTATSIWKNMIPSAGRSGRPLRPRPRTGRKVEGWQMPAEIGNRCEAVEQCYEFLLAYAAQGLPTDRGSASGGQVREFLERAVNALA